jgi:SAM-dependent methyltransferase
MYAVEDDHWWYTGMRRVADALLAERFADRRGSLAVLDAGCGTGGNSAHLRAYGSVTGVDFSADALTFARERPAIRLARASVEALPFADATFDLILSNDVLCHLGVANDAAAAREFRRVLRPGGVLYLQLPAYEWLRSHHDEAVHTGHRYAADELRRLLVASDLHILRITYANAALLPAATLWRGLNRLRPGRISADHSDVRPVPGPLNAMLRRMLTIEASLLIRRNLRAGLSVIGVAEKQRGAENPSPIDPARLTESVPQRTLAAVR